MIGGGTPGNTAHQNVNNMAILQIVYFFLCSSSFKISQPDIHCSYPILRYSSAAACMSMMYEYWYHKNSLYNRRIDTMPKSPPSVSTHISLIIILLVGDIQLNPGLTQTYPCGYCEAPVTRDHQIAICCDECSIWYHYNCLEMSDKRLSLLQRSDVSLICCKCNTKNVDSFTYHSYEFEISNRFSVIQNESALSSIPSIDLPFSSSAFSSPKQRQRSSTTDESSHRTSESLKMETTNKKNFRILMINCQSI